MDDKGVCKDCNNRKYCEDYKPNKWQCEDYEAQHTNEEWLECLTTEEKAKWLSKHSQFMYNCGEIQAIPKIMYEEDWEYWLKQPHKEE